MSEYEAYVREAARQARRLDDQGRYHPETGEPLDKLPKGSVPMWQRNGEGNRIEKEIEPVKEEFPF